MTDKTKKVGAFLIIITYIVLVVFVLVRDHKEDIQNILKPSLDFVGGKLYAMVKEPGEKEKVAQAYDEFKQQVMEQKIPPEQVESVVANVLNLSNSGASISPDQARYLLGVKSNGAIKPTDSLEYQIAGKAAPSQSTATHPEGLKNLAKRLNVIHDFNVRIAGIAQSDSLLQHEILSKIKYHFNNGIKVAIAPDAEREFQRERRNEIEKAVKQLEQNKILVWNSDAQKELKVEMKKLEKELQVLSKMHVTKSMTEQGVGSPDTLIGIPDPPSVFIVGDSVKVQVKKKN